MAKIYGRNQWSNRIRRVGNIRLAGGTTMNMNWLGKVRSQVAIAMAFLGVAMLYAIQNDAFELASAFGGFIAMLAKEVIASDD